jgi:AraC-like DNA-binding protein
LGVSQYTCDPCRITRSARDIARSDSDDLLLLLNLSGKGHHTQGGRQGDNEKGSFLLLDCRQPYTTIYPERVHSVTFKIPRQGLEARLGNLAELTARPIAPRGAVSGLASGFLSMLPSRIDTLDATAGSRLAEQALDLIALAVAEEAGQSGAMLSSVRKTTLFRLKTVIETHLCEPHLRPTVVAAEAGISVRYANALLSHEGFSIERYILHRRLERCRRALEDPTQSHRQIGEIAFSWGFSDLSHFGRRFRAAYGLSPGEWRRRDNDKK